jgi:hypothetical protein
MLDTKGYKHTEEYVMLIAFPRQKWLGESRSLLTTIIALLEFKISIQTDIPMIYSCPKI